MASEQRQDIAGRMLWSPPPPVYVLVTCPGCGGINRASGEQVARAQAGFCSASCGRCSLTLIQAVPEGYGG